MQIKQPKIIYFIDGPVPSEADYIAVAEIGVQVAYRNVNYIDPKLCLEECDGVGGAVPECYANKPDAEKALEDWRASLKARKEALPDVGGTAEIVETKQEPVQSGAKPAWGGMPVKD